MKNRVGDGIFVQQQHPPVPKRRIGLLQGGEMCGNVRAPLLGKSPGAWRKSKIEPLDRHNGDLAHDGESKSFDQSGIDEQPVEAACLGAVGAQIKQPATAVEDAFLLDESGMAARMARPNASLKSSDRSRARADGAVNDMVLGS